MATALERRSLVPADTLMPRAVQIFRRRDTRGDATADEIRRQRMAPAQRRDALRTAAAAMRGIRRIGGLQPAEQWQHVPPAPASAAQGFPGVVIGWRAAHID